MKQELEWTETQVSIPNLEGDGIAEVVNVKIPVVKDPHTGEEMLTPEAVELIENTKARHMGLMLPSEIKSLRQRLSLTQSQISELLQAGEKSYTRWETGRSRPSRMVNVVLRALHDGKLTVEYLRSQRHTSFDWSNVVSCDFGQTNPAHSVWVSQPSASKQTVDPVYEDRIAAA